MTLKALTQCIREIKLLQVTSRYPREVGLNARLGIHGWGPTSPIAVIITESGAMGWGVSRISPEDAERFVGRAVGELIEPGEGVIATEAMALDFPLHDLAGVLLGEPVYALLGGKSERTVPCYDGAIYMDDLLPFDNPRGLSVVLENCRSDYALGYRAFKLKIGRGNKWMEPDAGLARDIEVTRRVREAYPECDILVDANDGYTLDGFRRYLQAVADCNLFWIEEPFRENAADLRGLRETLVALSPSTRLADGEAQPDVPQLLDLARDKLLDVLIMDVVGLGFTAWRRLMPALIERNVLAAPHTWGDPLKTRYAAHLAAGLGNVLTLEGVPGENASVDWSGYRLEEGLLHIPAAPGFGMKLELRA